MFQPLATVCALGVAIAALTGGALATIAGWPDTLPRHLLLYLAAGGAWVTALVVVPRLPRSRGQLWAIALLALALRVPAWLTPPAHSDDVWRYLWDARVQAGGYGPYDFAPDAAALAPLRDAAWPRMNNPQLPTVYPPGAQLLFRVLARSLASWKLSLALFDAAAFGVLILWLRRRGDDPRRALAWGWSPLVTIELGVNAHVDGIGAALLMGALAAWEGPRLWRWLAGALLAASAAVKLLAAPLLPAFRDRRALAGFVLALALLVAPFAGAGARMSGSLGEYGRRWRANDGAFAVLYAGAVRAVAHTRFARRYTPGSPRLARLVSGRDRDQIYPDEVANFAARAAALLLFATIVGLVILRGGTPLAVGEAAVGAFLLLSPTLHPWYAVWLLPFVAVSPPARERGPTATGTRWAWPILAALVPLGYWPLASYLDGGGWHDPVWTRVFEHGLPLIFLSMQLTPRARAVT
jgi:hypothetical protein